MFQFLNTVREKLFETFSIVYHNLLVGYHELSTNLMEFKLCLHFIQLKTFLKHLDSKCLKFQLISRVRS
jgi:hypothetical protein